MSRRSSTLWRRRRWNLHGGDAARRGGRGHFVRLKTLSLIEFCIGPILRFPETRSEGVRGGSLGVHGGWAGDEYSEIATYCLVRDCQIGSAALSAD